MIQCFAKRPAIDIFIEPHIPKLAYVCKIDHDYNMLPRIMHKHDDIFEIMLVCDGTGEWIIGEKRYKVKVGDLILFNSGVLHDEEPRCNQDLIVYCLGVSNIYVGDLSLNCMIPDGVYPILQSGNQFSDIKNLLELIYCQLTSGQLYAEVVCHHLMISLLYIVLQLLQGNKPIYNNEEKQNYLLGKRIKDYIDERYTQKLSLNSISKAINISPYYLAHIFKETIGYSPMQYMTRRRIGESQTLLINTEDPIRKIAKKVGYNNISYFNAQFVKYVGMAPGEYRKVYTGRKP